MSDLTIVMAVYGQPKILAHQLETILGYPESVRDRLKLFIIDDHGDPPVDVDLIIDAATRLKEARLYRVDDDIPWNQMGARNLGMKEASGVCMMLDPDMVWPADMMARMLAAASSLKRGNVMKWALRHKSGGRIDMTSPNTWTLHRDDFWKVGGYDEDFAGNKGWSDVTLLGTLMTTFKIEQRPDLYPDFLSVKDVPDAMVTSLNRSIKVNLGKRLAKVRQSRAMRGWARWAEKVNVRATKIRFAWTRLF